MMSKQRLECSGFNVIINGNVIITDARTHSWTDEKRLPGSALKTIIENILGMAVDAKKNLALDISDKSDSKLYSLGIDDDDLWDKYNIDLMLVSSNPIALAECFQANNAGKIS